MQNDKNAITLPKRRSRGRLRGVKLAPYVFCSGFVICFLAFQVFPILYTFYLSLTNWSPFEAEISFVGLKNYFELFQDERFRIALKNTFILVAMITPVQAGIGLFIAAVLSRKFFSARVRNTFRLFNFMPYLTSAVALGLFFGIMFDPFFGYVNKALELLHISGPDWTGEVWPARFLVAMVVVWRWSGYTSVMLLAGITNISQDIYDAAEVDGAGEWQTFRRITLPLLRPVLIFVILTNMIGCFQLLEEPMFLFGGGGSGNTVVGGPRNAVLTGVWVMYDTAFGSTMRYGYGAAISYGMFFVICLVTLVFNKIAGWGGDEK